MWKSIFCPVSSGEKILKVMKILLAVCVVAAMMRLVPAGGDDDEKDDVGTVIGIDLGTTYSW